MYYLHYLRFNLDERKTLTKISMRKPLTTVPQTSAHLGRQLEGKQQVIQKRAVCITGGEPGHKDFIKKQRKNQENIKNWFCIKFYIILYQIFNTRKILQISVTKFKIQNIIFNSRKLLLNASTKFKIQNIIFNSRKLLQISVTKFKNHRCYPNVSRNIIT